MTSTNQVGVLIAQLGTPDAPTPQALRSYLRRFLSDRRVIDYPAWVWQPILRGIILRSRPRRSARLYARIWTPAGSPLRVFSDAQVSGVQERLGPRFRVVLGMTYGQPSIREALAGLEAEGISRVIVLPMFPQYSSTTTAPIYDAVVDAAGDGSHRLALRRKRTYPSLRFVEPYFDDPRFIETMRSHLCRELAAQAVPPDITVLTFHGIPARYVRDGDPYREQCEITARLLTEAMGWDESQWTIGFQSRFGPENWLEPYTDQVIERLAREGKRIAVFSPGFTTDCLETLDELGNEGGEAYTHAGGAADGFRLAPCLNDNPNWLDYLAGLIKDNSWRTT